MAKILLISHEILGDQMAGPGIRYFEFAKALSKKHHVVLFCPNNPTFSQKIDFEIYPLNFRNLRSHFKGADAVISQSFSPHWVILANQNNLQIILDAYAPDFIEHFELNKHLPHLEQETIISKRISSIRFSLKMADFIICANERQKALWFGMFAALRKFDPLLYHQDDNLNNLIGIVPFGISRNSPKKTGPGLIEKLNLPASSKVLVWGGGIWNWFDPLVLIQAIALLEKKGKDIHLLFMGTKHPNEIVPEMKMTKEAYQLAEKLRLLNHKVHFNFGWVPYHERQNTLLEADVGVSCHFNNVETHFSFRTRMLDYLWAELPIICTQGDVFAEFVEKHSLGYTVPPKNPVMLASAIEKILDEGEEKEKIRNRICQIKSRFFWDEVIKPIDDFLSRNKKEYSALNSLRSPFIVAKEFISERGVVNIAKHFIGKIFK